MQTIQHQKIRTTVAVETIYNSIIDYERSKPAGLNGFILLMHIGAGPGRTDKFYTRLPKLIEIFEAKRLSVSNS